MQPWRMELKGAFDAVVIGGGAASLTGVLAAGISDARVTLQKKRLRLVAPALGAAE